MCYCRYLCALLAARNMQDVCKHSIASFRVTRECYNSTFRRRVSCWFVDLWHESLVTSTPLLPFVILDNLYMLRDIFSQLFQTDQNPARLDILKNDSNNHYASIILKTKPSPWQHYSTPNNLPHYYTPSLHHRLSACSLWSNTEKTLGLRESVPT